MSQRDISIGAKVAHVRAAIQDGRSGGHHCHWPGCDRRVPPASWGCKEHWFKLPERLRKKLWAAYRPGQEASKTPSPEYVAVAREIQDWITAQEPRQQSMF